MFGNYFCNKVTVREQAVRPTSTLPTMQILKVNDHFPIKMLKPGMDRQR
jgi:hypothetical protein